MNNLWHRGQMLDMDMLGRDISLENGKRELKFIKQ